MARFRPDAFPGGNPWQVFRFMHPKSGFGQEKAPLPGNISPPCIQNKLALARYARHVSEKPRKSLLEDASREYLARKGPFSLHGPLESCIPRRSCHPSPPNSVSDHKHGAALMARQPAWGRQNRARAASCRAGWGAAEGVRGAVGASSERPRRVGPLARRLLLSCAYSASAYGSLSARSEPPAFRSMKKLARWYFLH